MSRPEPDPVEPLRRRMAALETEHFALVQQLQQLAMTTERNAHALDDFEDIITEMSVSATENADAMADAMAQRQEFLDTGDLATGNTAAVPAGNLVADLARDGETPPPAAGRRGAGGDRERVTAPELGVLQAWVAEHIAPMVRKTTTTGEGGGIRWCRQWWAHRDAVERFGALYLAFQELSVDESATWLSVYLRDHLDPHLATLTSPYGPFYACSPRKHSGAIEVLGIGERPSAEHAGSLP